MTFSLYRDWIQDVLYGSPPLQLLTSIAVIFALVALFVLIRSLRNLLGDRYTRNAAEAIEMAVLAGSVVVAAYVLADIWALSFVFDEVLDAIFLDRFTGIRGAVSIAILVASYLLVRMVNRSFDRLYREDLITNHQKEVAYHTADAGIVAVAGLVVMSIWGIELTNLILSAGVVSAIFGLAAQKTVAAFVAGFLLLFTRPFRAGDWIEVANQNDRKTAGIVQDITISHTKIRTFNDEHVLVPNDELTSNELINYSRSNRLRVDIELGVDYDTDLHRARTVIRDAIDDIDIISPLKEPQVVSKRFGDSAVVLELQFWIENPKRRRVWQAQTTVIDAIKDAFEREAITIPYPQRTHQARGDRGFRVTSMGSMEGERGLESEAGESQTGRTERTERTEPEKDQEVTNR
ncbi:mechanosensitive channel protein MscS [Natrialba magadii ATCC 43099]|uniref:Mechanosensitive channel protein MscS n=1 Tax=Natrialba magadii (strain ATCC 43099 / DSM 3394 / CCM 3739 / CIP 104546 / IAM 13178 / JCM 8861 / NBRC 102185 / NCIMB 2190 / MS3) TaxID=547559 RepID=D3SXZ2_NATMM|nr:mechanosensitive ion channel family protein [Natrialba magadii]ADD04032.1 mechanosensitive channel protein MscS [Natrialba magadii ATCC 43099]ELY33189.1 mechanosensitive ion channel protein MscS [Natrialba magadii ATCC 43099]